MKIIIALIVCATVFAVPAVAAPTAQQNAVVDVCTDWFSKRAWDGPVEVQTIAGGLCFNGAIAAGDDKKLTDALTAFKPEEPFVVVLRSGGGDGAAGMAMGEALTGRPVTTVASQICGSACANFLLPAGRRKVVLKGTLLLFHGSVNMDHLNLMAEQTRTQITALAAQNPDLAKESEEQIGIVVEQSRVQLAGMVARQEALLEKQDISPSLFRWMDLFNHMTPVERAGHCPTTPHMITYPPQLLAQFGYKIDAYDGALSQAEVDAAAVEQKLGKPMCYWRP